MIFDLLTGDPRQAIVNILLLMPVVMLALSLHETAHGYAAYKCGDNTAYLMGRLSLNPLRHLDPIGFLCMLVFGFGWAKPVPISTRNFKNPKKGMIISALAGPLANFLLGVICSLLFGVADAFYGYYYYIAECSEFALNCLSYTALFFLYGAEINFIFAFFNMIPVPPFDGSRLALAFLPAKTYWGIMKYERQIMLGILITLLVLAQFNLSPFSILARKLNGLLSGLTGEGVWRLLLKP